MSRAPVFEHHDDAAAHGDVVYARLAGMSTSAFHRHLRAVTKMSPRQFQKRIRLQEGRSLPPSLAGDAARLRTNT